MLGLKVPIVNPNLVIYIYINLKLVIFKILSIVFIVVTLVIAFCVFVAIKDCPHHRAVWANIEVQGGNEGDGG